MFTMPDLAEYLVQILLLPDVLRYISETLHFHFLRLVPALLADSQNVAGVSCPPGSDVAHSHPPSKLGSLQQSPTQTPSPFLSVAQAPTNNALTTDFNQSQQQRPSDVPLHSQPPATAPQQLLLSEALTVTHPRSPTPDSQDRKNLGMFYQASTFSLPGAVLIDNNADNASIHINNSDKFMERLLEKTIPGAAFDSSARDPPPRCHPGTRLAILDRCVAFISSCTGERKIRWVIGAAGVGKSAIMQSVAEHPLASVSLSASIFFFANGRSDGSKAIVTLAYQLAVQSEPYRQLIKQGIARDPSLLQKSMSAQFTKFLVEPFIHHSQLISAGRVLIIIDGLDECNQSRTQRELLRLISDFCLIYPSSPVVWMIASRPEPHITSFFDQPHVAAAYEKEEVLVDANEAREDVERFLRIELTRIKAEFSLNPQAWWPSERDFWRLANASGGLFVYAQTVVKYIGDPDIGDPIVQLNDVLQAIGTHPLANIPREEHPMALLDALYAQILTRVPTKLMENVRKLLLTLVFGWERICDPAGRNFLVLCNWLGMTSDEAYAAIRHLSSVLDAPSYGEAHVKQLRPFHKSFIDYVSDSSRSGFSPDIKRDASQLFIQCTFRILEQAPVGINFGDLDYDVSGVFTKGTLARGGPSTGGNISLTWPADERSGWDDNRTRLFMYKVAITNVVDGVMLGQQAFRSVICLRLVATRFQSFAELAVTRFHEVVFDQSRRHEFLEQGLLRKMPVKMLDISAMIFNAWLLFHRPTTPNLNLPDPWHPSCTHQRGGEWGEGKDQTWSTYFSLNPLVLPICNLCRQRFECQLESWKERVPDYPVSVFFTSTGICFVEFQFIDPEDGVSKWTYWIMHKFSEERRKELGSTV